MTIMTKMYIGFCAALRVKYTPHKHITSICKFPLSVEGGYNKNIHRHVCSQSSRAVNAMGNKQFSPVVMGGMVLDSVIHIEDTNLKLDGRTVAAAAGARAGGGVARNVAAALALMGATPALVSVVGDDADGRFLMRTLPPAVEKSHVRVERGEDARTPVYSALLGRRGDVRLGIADMRLHGRLSAAALRAALLAPPPPPPIAILDGNAPAPVIASALATCRDSRVPVWFEPTDVNKATKPFETDLWKTISFMSPNLNELRTMVTALGEENIAVPTDEPAEKEAWMLAKHLLKCCPTLTLLVTLGPSGVLVARYNGPDESFLSVGNCNKLSVRLYPAPRIPVESVVCESGAGDCLVAGVVMSILLGHTEEVAMNTGLAAAETSLRCPYAVPESFPGCIKNAAATFQVIE